MSVRTAHCVLLVVEIGKISMLDVFMSLHYSRHVDLYEGRIDQILYTNNVGVYALHLDFISLTETLADVKLPCLLGF